MGVLDGLIGNLVGNPGLRQILGSLLGGAGPGGTPAGAAPGASGGLGPLIEQFRRAGFGPQAESWVGAGPNQPVSPDILSQVFGQDRVQAWARTTGIDPSELLANLSQLLPHLVDRATPEGRLPAGPPPGPDYASPFEDAGTELPSGPTRQA